MRTKYLISVSQTQKKFSKNFHFGLQSNVKGDWEQLIVVKNSLKAEYWAWVQCYVDLGGFPKQIAKDIFLPPQSFLREHAGSDIAKAHPQTTKGAMAKQCRTLTKDKDYTWRPISSKSLYDLWSRLQSENASTVQGAQINNGTDCQ